MSIYSTAATEMLGNIQGMLFKNIGIVMFTIAILWGINAMLITVGSVFGDANTGNRFKEIHANMTKTTAVFWLFILLYWVAASCMPREICMENYAVISAVLLNIGRCALAASALSMVIISYLAFAQKYDSKDDYMRKICFSALINGVLFLVISFLLEV